MECAVCEITSQKCTAMKYFFIETAILHRNIIYMTVVEIILAEHIAICAGICQIAIEPLTFLERCIVKDNVSQIGVHTDTITGRKLISSVVIVFYMFVNIVFGGHSSTNPYI
jgi:hypothetical protein